MQHLCRASRKQCLQCRWTCCLHSKRQCLHGITSFPSPGRSKPEANTSRQNDPAFQQSAEGTACSISQYAGSLHVRLLIMLPRSAEGSLLTRGLNLDAIRCAPWDMGSECLAAASVYQYGQAQQRAAWSSVRCSQATTRHLKAAAIITTCGLEHAAQTCSRGGLAFKYVASSRNAARNHLDDGIAPVHECHLLAFLDDCRISLLQPHILHHCTMRFWSTSSVLAKPHARGLKRLVVHGSSLSGGQLGLLIRGISR